MASIMGLASLLPSHSSLLAYVLYIVMWCVGNMGADSGGECGVPTFHRFTSPANGNGLFWSVALNLGFFRIYQCDHTFDFRYSFDQGLVHVIQMSSEVLLMSHAQYIY